MRSRVVSWSYRRRNRGFRKDESSVHVDQVAAVVESYSEPTTVCCVFTVFEVASRQRAAYAPSSIRLRNSVGDNRHAAVTKWAVHAAAQAVQVTVNSGYSSVGHPHHGHETVHDLMN